MSTLLIVDDEQLVRESLSVMLEASDYQLILAENGEKALQIAEQVLPDLILLDVMMPGMDGFEVCRRIRSNKRLLEVPIVMLTALDDRESLLEGLNAGADDFLTKPIEGRELRARVQTITRLNRYQTLMQQREDLRKMANRVIQAQEQERMRISREIHDDIGQALTAHQLSLQMIHDQLPSETSQDLRHAVQELIADTGETFAKLRLMAQDLRPPLIDTLGIQAALRAYCKDFERRSGLPLLYDEDDGFPKISDTVSITLYRVLQESLSNIVRYSKASQVWVSVNVDEGTISLTVQYNGIGITNEDLAKKGIGLKGMQERVTLSGGNFVIRSTPKHGTIITITFPVDA